MSVKKLIYICAPLRGDVAGNLAKARKYCEYVTAAGYVPVCPHLLFAGLLDDENPCERQAALRIGLELVPICAELWVFTAEITEGMQPEIDRAKGCGISVFDKHDALPAAASGKAVNTEHGKGYLNQLDELGAKAMNSAKLMDLVLNGPTLMSVPKDTLRGIIRALWDENASIRNWNTSYIDFLETEYMNFKKMLELAAKYIEENADCPAVAFNIVP